MGAPLTPVSLGVSQASISLCCVLAPITCPWQNWSAAQFCHGQVIGANTQQSDIDAWLTPNETGVKGAPIRQRHLHPPCIGNHVGIGQNLSIRGKDETRAYTTILPRHIVLAIAPPLMLQVYTYDRRPNAFRRRHYRT